METTANCIGFSFLSNIIFLKESSIVQSTLQPLEYYRTLPSEMFVTIVTATVCSLGIISNSLVIAVIVLSSLKNSVFMTLVMTLAISEILYLVTIINIQIGIFGNVFIDPSLLHCRLNLYFMFVSGLVSSWITVLISLERVVAVFFPLKVHIYCSKRKTYSVLVTLFIIVSGIVVPIFGTCSVTTRDGRPICRTAGLNAKNDMIFILFIYSAYSILPFCIITVSNILSAVKIKSKRAFWSHSQGQRSSHRISRNQASPQSMMVAISIVFMVTSFPGSLLAILRYSCPFIQGLNCKVIHGPLSQLAFSLDYINHCVNFFLYCVTGSTFRNALFHMVRCKRRLGSKKDLHPGLSISGNVV